MSENAQRSSRRKLVGVVTSDKMDKTIVVKVERLVQHPRFKKYVRRSTAYKVHDENNEAREGDRVELMETRPLSKGKNHRLVRTVARAPGTQQES